jgi:signal transduction histidine kinase
VTFRARLLAAFTVATVVPLVLLGLGVRHQLRSRLALQYRRRVDAQVAVASEDLGRQSASIADRLAALAHGVPDDDRFRLAAVRGVEDERPYLLDYAGRAMRLAGLSMLQVEDARGRILSSGHFRNEFDRLEPDLPALMSRANGQPTLVRARAPDGPLLVLARVDSAQVAGRRFTLVGGIAVDSAFLRRLARDPAVGIALVVSGDRATMSVPHAVVAEIPLAYIDAASRDAPALGAARLTITQPLGDLDALLGSVNRWFLAALAGAIGLSAALAAWFSARLSRPLMSLAAATGRIELDGPEVALGFDRDDEIGTLARRLSAMATRLRSSAGRLRAAERRATIGEMARQVNHDIKNGLVPIRNVLRHLAQVQEERPVELPTLFAERRSTLESSVAYLDTLARNYARLSPVVQRTWMDVNAIVAEVGRAAGSDGALVASDLAPAPPRIGGDPVLLRRILENLVRNGIESLEGRAGTVTLRTAGSPDRGVRVTVADTGHGMTREEIERAFDDFHTTRKGGTGLGLSVVRRLTADLQGTLRIESEPGRGTTVILDFPGAGMPG